MVNPLKLVFSLVLLLSATACGAKTQFVQQGRASYPQLVHSRFITRAYRDDLHTLEEAGAGVVGWIHSGERDANTGAIPRDVALLGSRHGGTHLINGTCSPWPVLIDGCETVICE